MVQGVLSRIRSRIISTFGTKRVVVRQPYAPAAFTPGEIFGSHFQRLSRPQGTKEPRKKKSPVTPPGIDLRTVGLLTQRLNHYATPGPYIYIYIYIYVQRQKILSFIFPIYNHNWRNISTVYI